MWKRQLEQIRLLITMIEKRERLKLSHVSNIRDQYPFSPLYFFVVARSVNLSTDFQYTFLHFHILTHFPRFDAEHAPNQRVYRLVLERLRDADPEQYFEYPVNPEFAPLYAHPLRLMVRIGCKLK